MTLRRQPEEGIAGEDDGIEGTAGVLGAEERGAATAARAFGAYRRAAMADRSRIPPPICRVRDALPSTPSELGTRSDAPAARSPMPPMVSAAPFTVRSGAARPTGWGR